MDGFQTFLESSTIHGLTYISTTRKYVRIFWILIVVSGFTGAGVLIYQSFQAWDESPVKTTIETMPISNLSYPKVTVCPPKNTYTDLNHYIMMVDNLVLDNDTRNNLTDYATAKLQDAMNETLGADLNKLYDYDRYHN